MLRCFLALGLMIGSTLAAQAQLIVSSYFNSAVYNYSPTGGGLQGTIIPPFGSGVNAPSRITFGPDNHLYISNQGTDATNNSILRYDFSTSTVSTVLSPAALQAVAGAGNYYAPTGIKFGPDGLLYVARNGGLNAADGSGAIDKFSSDGTFLGTIATGLSQPTALTINGSTLYVSNLRGGPGGTGDVDRVLNFTTTPTLTDFIAPTSNGLFNPTGTTWGPDGKFYVADVDFIQQGFGCKVLRYNADGSPDGVFALPNGMGQGALAFAFPSDVLFRDDGNLLVAGLGFPGNFPGVINLYNGTTGVFEQSILTSNDISPSSIAFVPEPGLLIALSSLALIVARRASKG